MPEQHSFVQSRQLEAQDGLQLPGQQLSPGWQQAPPHWVQLELDPQYEPLRQAPRPSRSRTQQPPGHWASELQLAAQRPPLRQIWPAPQLQPVPAATPPPFGAAHWPPAQYCPVAQLPQLPPQPSLPHCLPPHEGVQGAHHQSGKAQFRAPHTPPSQETAW